MRLRQHDRSCSVLLPRVDSLLANLDVFYTPPWMRILPYMVGILVGVLWVRMDSSKVHITNSSWVRAYWFAVGGVAVASLFGIYFKTAPDWMFAVGFSVGRLVLSLCWASAIVACAVGHGGAFNRLLSCRVFVHLDRLTYMMYLLNPVIVVALVAGQTTTESFEVASTVSLNRRMNTCVWHLWIIVWYVYRYRKRSACAD